MFVISKNVLVIKTKLGSILFVGSIYQASQDLLYLSFGSRCLQWGNRPGSQYSNSALKNIPEFQSVVKFVTLQSGNTAYNMYRLN